MKNKPPFFLVGMVLSFVLVITGSYLVGFNAGQSSIVPFVNTGVQMAYSCALQLATQANRTQISTPTPTPRATPHFNCVNTNLYAQQKETVIAKFDFIPQNAQAFCENLSEKDLLFASYVGKTTYDSTAHDICYVNVDSIADTLTCIT